MRIKDSSFPPGSHLLTALEAHSSRRKETKQRSRRGGLALSRLEAQGAGGVGGGGKGVWGPSLLNGSL